MDHVLLVEDEPTLRTILCDVLAEAGYAALPATSGTQAMWLLDAHRPTLRGLITDVKLGPGPDGWDVARHARAMSPDLPVVYLSGIAAHEWPACGVPGSTVFLKPFSPAEIVAVVSDLLARPPQPPA